MLSACQGPYRGLSSDARAEALVAERLDLATPSAGELEEWLVALRPTPAESSWELIPWLPSFAAGIEAANAAQRPLLFWGMNGHPLGCT